MAKLVSTTYADALFETGIEENTLDELYNEALSVKQILEENPDFLDQDEEVIIRHGCMYL